MPDKPSNPYDAIAYPCFPYPDTHPANLAARAILYGLQPAPVDRCRVLEIACNAGGNLIPMAYSLPESEFVGFDLAASPIQAGQERIRELGLRNIQLMQLNLLDAGEHPALHQPFDYIVAHGLYPWVPAAVRNARLEFCRQYLTPQGVAFISYAALPGAHMRLLTRDILQNSAGSPEPVTPLPSLDWLEFVTSFRPEGDGFRVLLQRELEGMHKRGTAVLFHDELAEWYLPVLFQDFAAHAARHGLQFVCEAELPGPVDPSYRADVMSRVKAQSAGSRIREEQLLDHLRMRMYRQSLLCPAATAVSEEVNLAGFAWLLLSSSATSAPGSTPGARVYTSPEGLRIETQHPATLALLECLVSRYPEMVSLEELAHTLQPLGVTLDASHLTMLMRLAVSRILTLQAWQPPVAGVPGPRPVASAVARLDARNGENVTTLLHTRVSFSDPISRQLLLLLDGSRDREALLRDLAAALPDQQPESLATDMETALHLMARVGLLEQPDWRQASATAVP